ncbi:hypothetical protein CC80DRAFT_403749 [Byssothecium circinans]|uniref:Uncharacterized protein n=1 Tax=Byssothecium circinans TaxID=147558 RepID=A0A6A5UA51_9PLEO|nr:hypothetical protein CC80DRAFT_403749 [Byssothecium circinans]
MCHVEETIYINSNGGKRTQEVSVPCDRAKRRHGKLCSNVKKRTTEYYTKPESTISRGEASSPASNGPFTPPTAGSGGYRTEERRPSGILRPSTQDGHRAIRPEVIIELGGKGRSSKYPQFTLSTTKPNKRSSLGASSINSNEAALESPGSESSYPIRTGFPEAPIAPSAAFAQPQGYTTRHAVPQGHRHTASSSSHTIPSQVPSLTSEPESPAGRRPARYPPALVHNPMPVAPPSPTVSRAAPRSSRDNIGVDGVTPYDYNDFVRPATSSNASSSRAAAPEITDRAADRERMRREAKRRQEEEDRRLAEDLAREEDVKQVRFELGRHEDRTHQRAESKQAESEKQRAHDREEAREEAARRRRQQEPEKRATKKPTREKTKPPTNDFNKPRRTGSTSRRNSVTLTPTARDLRDLLLEEDRAQLAREREASDRRDREEQQLAGRGTSLVERQENPEYYSTRSDDRVVTNNGPGIGGRRASVSRRGSVSGNPPPLGLARSNSRSHGVSIIQNAPPAPSPLAPAFPAHNPYSTRPPSSQLQNAPPLSFPGSYTASARPPSARHSSYDNPFIAAPSRSSNTSQDNPFAAPSTRPIHPSGPTHSHDGLNNNPFSPTSSVLQSPVSTTRDPWDNRELHATLPQSTGYPVRNAMQMAGEQVINRSGDRAHGRARQATHTMGAAIGYEDDYEGTSTSSEEEQRSDRVRVRERERSGRSTLGQGKGKRRS